MVVIRTRRTRDPRAADSDGRGEVDEAARGERATDGDPAPGAGAGEPTYRLRDVIRIFREGDVETVALRGIDLDVGAGEFVALVGRSGSGKSTLLALLAGADRPSAGTVRFHGTDIGRASEPVLQRLRGREVSLLFQNGNLVPFLSVAENMALAAALAGRPLDAGLAGAIVGRLRLTDRVGHRPAQLSGGEQQRAALACALASGARVLLLDEPTAELDSRTADAVLEVVRSLHEDLRLTVVVATHDRAVAAAADHVVTLASGRIVDGRAP